MMFLLTLLVVLAVHFKISVYDQINKLFDLHSFHNSFNCNQVWGIIGYNKVTLHKLCYIYI